MTTASPHPEAGGQTRQAGLVPSYPARSPGPAELRRVHESNLALSNLRAFVILLVLAFHSVLAYLGSQPASPPPFDSPPYWWRAIPILDKERWFGFDLFSAFTYVYLMQLMFLISGLFVWPSLVRKGGKLFLHDRFCAWACRSCWVCSF